MPFCNLFIERPSYLLVAVDCMHSKPVCDVVSGAAVAGVYRASGFEMAPMYALVWGVGQTILVIFISFTRILATL